MDASSTDERSAAAGRRAGGAGSGAGGGGAGGNGLIRSTNAHSQEQLLMRTTRSERLSRKQIPATTTDFHSKDRNPKHHHRPELDDSDEFSSFDALFEPRLRRHCSEKAPSSNTYSSAPFSRSSRQRSRRRKEDMENQARAAAGTNEDDGGGSRCNRSLSCRSRRPLRPTELNFGGAEPRRRTYSMPSKSKRAFIEAQRQLERSSSSSTPEDFIRVRTFSTSSKGILNKGDSFKRRRRAGGGTVHPSGGEATERDKAEVVPPPPPPHRADGKDVVDGKTSVVGRVLGRSAMSGEKSRVLVMGGAGVGKRSIMQQFLTSEYMGTADSSHEDSGTMTVSVVLDEEEATLDLTHHPSGITELTTSDRADAYCIVYSVSDRDSFLHAREILSEIKKKDLQRRSAEIVVANKADLVRQRQVTEDEGKLMAARYRSKYIEVSAVLNHKIDELLVGIIKQIRLKQNSSTSDRKKSTDDHSAGCYPAREIVSLILGKQRRTFNSCDNLLVL